jgi:hypothetical protein
MAQVYKEVGKRPRDEERRAWRFKHLREQRDKQNKIDKARKRMEEHIQDADDPFKSGLVVKYLAYFCGVMLVCLILFVAKDSAASGQDPFGTLSVTARPPPRARTGPPPPPPRPLDGAAPPTGGVKKNI